MPSLGHECCRSPQYRSRRQCERIESTLEIVATPDVFVPVAGGGSDSTENEGNCESSIKSQEPRRSWVQQETAMEASPSAVLTLEEPGSRGRMIKPSVPVSARYPGAHSFTARPSSTMHNKTTEKLLQDWPEAAAENREAKHLAANALATMDAERAVESSSVPPAPESDGGQPDDQHHCMAQSVPAIDPHISILRTESLLSRVNSIVKGSGPSLKLDRRRAKSDETGGASGIVRAKSDEAGGAAGPAKPATFAGQRQQRPLNTISTILQERNSRRSQSFTSPSHRRHSSLGLPGRLVIQSIKECTAPHQQMEEQSPGNRTEPRKFLSFDEMTTMHDSVALQEEEEKKEEAQQEEDYQTPPESSSAPPMQEEGEATEEEIEEEDVKEAPSRAHRPGGLLHVAESRSFAFREPAGTPRSGWLTHSLTDIPETEQNVAEHCHRRSRSHCSGVFDLHFASIEEQQQPRLRDDFTGTEGLKHRSPIVCDDGPMVVYSARNDDTALGATYSSNSLFFDSNTFTVVDGLITLAPSPGHERRSSFAENLMDKIAGVFDQDGLVTLAPSHSEPEVAESNFPSCLRSGARVPGAGHQRHSSFDLVRGHERRSSVDLVSGHQRRSSFDLVREKVAGLFDQED